MQPIEEIQQEGDMHGSFVFLAADGGSEPRLFYRPVETKVKIAGAVMGCWSDKDEEACGRRH